MSKHERFGNYLVNTGANFGLTNCITCNKYYVIDSHTKTAVGVYTEKLLALALAVSLDKTDRKKLAEEMDKLLSEG